MHCYLFRFVDSQMPFFYAKKFDDTQFVGINTNVRYCNMDKVVDMGDNEKIVPLFRIIHTHLLSQFKFIRSDFTK